MASLKLSLLGLKLTFLGSLLALGKVSFDPMLGKFSAYQFPAQVPLAHFAFLQSQPILSTWNNPQKTPQQGQLELKSPDLEGQVYNYQQNEVSLRVNMFYVKETTGDIATLIRDYQIEQQTITPEKIFTRMSEQGYYSLFEAGGKAYLSSCINPRGTSTVSSEQFLANRNRLDLQAGRWIPIMLGQTDVRDMRCLWIMMSMPLNHQPPGQVYSRLELAWQSWYQWWSPRFPIP